MNIPRELPSRCRFPSLRPTVRQGEVSEEWGEHAPQLGTRDRVSPDLGEDGLVDGNMDVWIWLGDCAYGSSKQESDR